MNSTFEQSVEDALESVLDRVEREYEAERNRIEQLLAECGKEKVAPAKDYWHRLDNLRRKVNLLRELTETKNG